MIHATARSPAIYTLSWFVAEAASSFVLALVLACFCRATNTIDVVDALTFGQATYFVPSARAKIILMITSRL